MHRKQDSDLIQADTELERTLRSLRKTKRAENAAMTDERHDQIEEQRTTALITMVQQHQFTGHPTEDPNGHQGRFLRMVNTVKLNGVRLEVIKLHLFHFL